MMTGFVWGLKRSWRRLVARRGTPSTVLPTYDPGIFGLMKVSGRRARSGALPNQALQADDRLPRPHGLGRLLAAERQGRWAG
jgi:hypothetical protein